VSRFPVSKVPARPDPTPRRRPAAHGSVVRPVPWWGLVSSAAAPLLLIGGWTVAAAVQPLPFDAVIRTISDLAAGDAAHRWLMTIALVGVGVCHVVTSCALGCAAVAGRLVLALGGLATILVAAFPLPGGSGSSSVHTAVAAVAFVSLALWPALAWVRPRASGQTVAVLLRPKASVAGAGVLSLLLAWFFVEQLSGGPVVGLSERTAAGAQAVWPLAVVLSARVSRQT
jgi:hypothetical membrane protein